jgi:hypothetical protein
MKRILKYILYVIIFSSTSCRVSYRFTDASVPAEIKTFKVVYIENKARYINPSLSPRLTDKLRQKIISQTRLTQNNESPHLEIIAVITEYSVTTSGVSNGSTPTTNRLNVGLNVQIKNSVKPENSLEENISRSFDFPAGQSLSQAEASRTDEIVKNVIDEIFNKIFSKW